MSTINTQATSAAIKANLDSVTAATWLRRDVIEVHRELEEKRNEFHRRMERVHDQEEQLKVERAKLQDTLVQYYKYIQDNELKRVRANKKATSEGKAIQERVLQIKQLRDKMADLHDKKEESQKLYLKNVQYQNFLEEVLKRNDNVEHQDPKDIIKRFGILDDNTKVLQKRKTQLEEDLGRTKLRLQESYTRKKNESVDFQNKLSDLQNKLEHVQKEIKTKQDDLETVVNTKGGITKTIGHVKMACQNLYDRCLEWNPQYKTRAHNKEAMHDVLHQLRIIGDCLLDLSAIIKQHEERVK